LHRERGDLQVEVIDERKPHVDVRPPRVGYLGAVEHLAAGVPEQLGDRAWLAECDEHGVDAVLQRRAMADQVQQRRHPRQAGEPQPSSCGVGRRLRD
jgi:hypothetical protein